MLGSHVNLQSMESQKEENNVEVKYIPPGIQKIRDKHNLTGRGRVNWKFYECLNEFLGNRPAICPAVNLDTSADILSTIVGEGSGDMPDEEKDEDEREYSVRSEEESGLDTHQ